MYILYFQSSVCILSEWSDIENVNIRVYYSDYSILEVVVGVYCPVYITTTAISITTIFYVCILLPYC